MSLLIDSYLNFIVLSTPKPLEFYPINIHPLKLLKRLVVANMTNA